jgi:hypothetical protein
MNFHTIISHEGPHLDELAAIWLLKSFGEEKFPGIEKARLIFDREQASGKSAADFEKEGVLLIGVGEGRGRFNEHPVNGDRKEGECAATLVAKELEVDDDPALQKILRYVLITETQGGAKPFELSSLVKTLSDEEPEKLVEWTTRALEAKYREQLQFWSRTKQEFEKNSKIETVPGLNGRMLKIAVVVSDDKLVYRFAFSLHGGRIAVVVQKKSTGNVQIFMNKRFGLFMDDIAQMIRYEEQRVKSNVVTTDWEMLRAEGKIEGVEEWYYHWAAQMLLNGSLTAPNVPPTKLSLEKIIKIVKVGVNPNAFEASRSSQCRRGKCTSYYKNQCGWYEWGLHRCREIRYRMKNQNFHNSR